MELTFGIPLVGLKSWFGRRYRTSSILPFNHLGGIDGVSEAGFEAMTLSFSKDYLADVASSFQISIPECILCPTTESIIDRGAYTDRFRGLLNRLFSNPEFRLEQEIEEELVVTLLQAAQAGSEVIDRSLPRMRARAIERALAYMAEHHEEVVTVRDICHENDIALRTLTRAFRERFGIGPKAYLKNRRLSSVRQELLSAPAETLVTDIANRWGFWHLGQFAHDYRSLFGELPSQTIKN